MIAETDARTKILEAVQPLPARKISISDSLDCFAAEDYLARLPLPLFDNSAMDGYAVIAANSKKDARLRVVGEQPAGIDRKLRVSQGEAIRIFTGAPIPAGADAVIMQEDVKREGDEIVISEPTEAGEFIRKRGCDLSEGQKILSKGEPIRSATVALLASQGLSEIAVGGEVRAAIISTGDELAKPGEQLQAGQIYDSNSSLVQALLNRVGAVVRSIERCGDDADSLQRAFQAGAQNEILIVTGGVSVGERDLVQETLRKLGAKIDIWRVAIKPGKPFLFAQVRAGQAVRAGLAPVLPSSQSSPSGRGRGTDNDTCLVFGLPGNPVSAFVTFLQFVRPAILKMMGAMEFGLPTFPAQLGAEIRNDSERVEYVRGRFERGRFSPVGRRESHALFGLSQSNALLRVGAGESFAAGAMVDVQIWQT